MPSDTGSTERNYVAFVERVRQDAPAVWEWLDGEGATLLAETFHFDENYLRGALLVQGPSLSASPRHPPNAGAARRARAEEEADPLRPEHYGGEGNPFEAIKVIEYYNLNFSLGSALKYLLRWDKKGGIEDLRKAAWYCNREADRLETVVASKTPSDATHDASRDDVERPRRDPGRILGRWE